MANGDYRFETRSRQAALSALAGAGLGLVGVAFYTGDLWLAAVGAAIPIPLVMAARMRPPPAGCAIEGGTLLWWTDPKTAESAALDSIRQAAPDGAGGVSLTLADGNECHLQAAAACNAIALLDALAARGVHVAEAEKITA